MPSYINDNIITFNGPASSADIVSNPVNLTGNFTSREMAWYFPLTCTAAGVWAVTLQFNPDPAGGSTFGWQDEARPTITVLNTLTGTNLAQTHASISSGMIRGGVVSSVGTYNCLMRFTPTPASYRLRFQLTTLFTGTIPKISVTSGI